MKMKNNGIDEQKNKDKLSKLGRGAVAMFLLGSNLMPGVVMASEIDIDPSDAPVEDVQEVHEIDETEESGTERFNAFAEPLAVEGENLLVDGDFEGSNSVWEHKSNSSVHHEFRDTQVGYIGTQTRDAFVMQRANTVPGNKYTFSADILTTNNEGGSVSGAILTTKPALPNNEQGAPIQEIGLQDTEEQWERHTIEFTAETQQTYVGIVKWADAGNIDAENTEILIDNASLVLTEDNQEEDVVEEYEVIWQDDFEGQYLNQDYWGYELGNIRGNEQQHYTSSQDNVYLEDGNLVLQATDRPEDDQYYNTERHGDNGRLVKYNSGSVRTHGKQEFLYGRIEASIRLPKGKGAFPAFWTLGADFPLDGRISGNHGYGWPQSGEIDIMEMIGAPTAERAAEGEEAVGGTSNSYTHGTAHFYYENSNDVDGDGAYAPYNIGGGQAVPGTYNDDFHVFGINWYPDRIEWFVDDDIFNTLTYEDTTNNPDNQARLDAAKMGLNRPQYIQLNLATGGNWAGDAGDFLGVDDTKVEVDWVRWSQTEEQQQAAAEYYASSPEIYGVQDMTITQGQEVNFLENVSTDLADYTVDFSIEDEYMFENSGGRNEVTLTVEDSQDLEGLANLEPGVYNIHYSAFPTGVQIQGRQYPEHPITRESAVLTVLPEELTGVDGEPLMNIQLPESMEWENPEQTLGSDASYDAVFRQLENTGTAEGNERRVFVKIPDEMIARPEPVDKIVLSNLIGQAELVDRTLYTEGSLAALDVALAEANVLVDSEDAVQAEIDTAAQSLQSALEALEELPAEDESHEELEDRLDELEELVSALSVENSEMSTEISQLLAQIAALQVELAQSSDVTSDLEERVTALESRLAELEDALSSEEGETTTEDVTPDEEAPTEEGASVDETEPSNENHVTSEDETLAQKSEDESDLPDTGEANTFGILLSGIALLVVGTTIAFKVKNEA